jgi:membrane-bound lytic murein transglycosylase B
VRRAVAGLLLVAAACSDGAGQAATTTSTSTSTTTTTTTVPSTTTTTAPPLLVEPGVRPQAADDPAGLATQLAESLGVIADPAATLEQVAAAGRLQQVAVRRLAGHPEWDVAVAAALPEPLRASVALDVAAGRELAALVRVPRETLPAWRIVEPAPPDELRRLYAEAEARFGVPWQVLAAVHLTETRMGRIRGTSTAGAQGPMQFLPSTWAAYGLGGNIDDTGDAILGAANYLAANGAARGDLDNALYRYNPTPRYVNAVKAYVERMRADERAFLGYWGWQVFYVTVLGDVWLRPGYEATEERPVAPADLD